MVAVPVPEPSAAFNTQLCFSLFSHCQMFVSIGSYPLQLWFEAFLYFLSFRWVSDVLLVLALSP